MWESKEGRKQGWKEEFPDMNEIFETVRGRGGKRRRFVAARCGPEHYFSKDTRSVKSVFLTRSIKKLFFFFFFFLIRGITRPCDKLKAVFRYAGNAEHLCFHCKDGYLV
jgi:hypothetical protein